MTIGDAPVTVTLSLKDGGTLSHTITVSPGSKGDPLTPDQLKTKWLDCLARGASHLDSRAAESCFDDGLGLADLPAFDAWVARLRPAPKSAGAALATTRLL
jgi:hypothetical protein